LDGLGVETLGRGMDKRAKGFASFRKKEKRAEQTRNTNSAWVAEQVDARDLKSLEA
jgi:hypothetical protein